MRASIVAGIVGKGSFQPLVGLDGVGNPVIGKGVLSNIALTTSDPAVFTVDVDPSDPAGSFLLTAVGTNATETASVSGTLLIEADSTEPGATTSTRIQGTATIIVTAVAAPPPPPPPPATSLLITFGDGFTDIS